ncbi:hypothetical protein ACHAWF_016878 [Thalassiosira exigua]
MDRATAELRDAVRLAFSLEPDGGGEGGVDRGDGDVPAEALAAAAHPPVNGHGQGHGSSQGASSYVSSLSGSLPSGNGSRRRQQRASNNGGGSLGGPDRDRSDQRARLRLGVAARVEAAVSNFELAAFEYYSGDIDEDQGASNDDVVDLLVAILTSVPRALLHEGPRGGANDAIDANDASDPQLRRDEEECFVAAERACHNAACAASDVLRRHFVAPDVEHAPMLEDRHLSKLINDAMRQACDDELCPCVEPIAKLLNSLSEGRAIERASLEGEGDVDGYEGYGDDGYGIFSRLSPEECLHWVHALMHRQLFDPMNDQGDTPGQVGYLAGYLLGHFSTSVASELERDSSEGRIDSLFVAWADSIDESGVRRLTEEEARDVHELVVQFHVAAVQSALRLIDDVESVVRHLMAKSNSNNALDDNALDGLAVALQDAVRHAALSVSATEAMHQLGLDPDPEIQTIFRPLVVSLARFVASSLPDATKALTLGGDGSGGGEELRLLADDALLRLCRSSLGAEFLLAGPDSVSGNEDDEVAGEVLAVALLRAASSHNISGKARFLLDLAVDRAVGKTGDGNDEAVRGPTVKRQRYDPRGFGSRLVRDAYAAKELMPEERLEETTDMLLACLALSHAGRDDDRDPSVVKSASHIASSLMSGHDELQSNGGNERALLDPLNPWHTLQLKPLQRLANLNAPPGRKDDEGNRNEPLELYAVATPHLLDTK